MSVAVTNNKMRLEDFPVHNWYRFVLSFPPHLVRHYIDKFGLDSSSVVLDPFCGTGTTLVECKKNGIRSIGIEPHPMSFFASSVKTDWRVNPQRLVEHATSIAKIAGLKLEEEGIRDVATEHETLFSNGEIDVGNLQRLSTASEKLLLKGSISDLPLHKTLILIETLEENVDNELNGLERLALAKALVTDIGNLHFGPEVGVGSPKYDAPVVGCWLNNVRTMANDLEIVENGTVPDSKVLCADSRFIADVLEPNSINAVITSPPYPNEKDYTRTTRLETVLLGFANDRQDLRQIKKRLIRSNTRGVYKGDDDDTYIADFHQIQEIADNIEKRRVELGKTSGFERLYGRVTKLYFGGMYKHLYDLRKALKPNAHLAYVVGDQASYLRVMIRTGELLSTIAQSLGYELIDTDLFRERLATATKKNLREEVVVLRWSG